MADIYSATTGPVSIAQAVTKTVCALQPPTSGAGRQVGKLVSFSVSFDGATSVQNLAARVDLGRCDATTAGTAGTAPTVFPWNNLVAATGLNTVTAAAYSAEPTVITVQDSWFVNPSSGLLVIQFPLGREPLLIPSGTANLNRVLLRLVTPATMTSVNYNVTMTWEE